jgi:carbon-monoxide dehydrogenase large subunit
MKPGSILGNSVRRVEDPELLVGAASFVVNLREPGLLHAEFVRSPLAHGRIVAIDTDDAAKVDGVVGVWTAADLDLPAHHGLFVLNERCARPPLATDKVRFVGEAVAVVVATSETAAQDAATAVVVDYEPLEAVVDPEVALADGAVLQFDDLGTNLAAGVDSGPEDPLAGAATVVRLRMVSPRVAVVPMEGDAIMAVPGDDGAGHDLTVWVATQMPHAFADALARVLGLDRETLRVVAPHVGGGFGAKAGLVHEHTVIVAVARRLGRPVRWVQGRSDNMVAMPHGRAQVQYIEFGFDNEGLFSGMRARVVADCGAYAGFGGALALGPTRMMAQGVYRIPRIRYAAAAAMTTTTPVGAFRGAGRPEATQMLERAMDLAASELGIDPVDLRRRNLIGSGEFPYTTQMGTVYDSGDYALALDRAVEVAGYDELRAEQRARRARGDRRQIGIGVSTYVEVTAGGGAEEYASLQVLPDGTATLAVGTSAHGQGHATAFAMIVADRLGLPVEAVRVIESDTAAVPRGGGTGGSRSLQLGGGAAHKAAGEVWADARRLAADLLEASEGDVELTGDGRVGVAGVPARALGWADLAQAAAARGNTLGWEGDVAAEGATFPFGAHVAVVEVDLDTGRVVPLRHIAVDDCGQIVNPMIVAGQQHGGIGQGIAQALWEEVVFDSDGNPRAATLAEYGMPSAAELPSFEVSNTETPTPRNALGAKGIGESGTIGSTPAVHNAVVDALSHLGVRHLDMPCTAEKVWRAGHDAEAGRVASPWREPPAALGRLPRAGDGTGQSAPPEGPAI